MNDPILIVTGRRLGLSDEVRRRNPHLCAAAADKTPTQAKRLRQESRSLMNKLEVEWYEQLKRKYANHVESIKVQSFRFRLANGLWYKPDFVHYTMWTAWEVKGPHAWRGGFENLKMAASVYPEWHWFLVWKDPESGAWQEQRVRS